MGMLVKLDLEAIVFIVRLFKFFLAVLCFKSETWRLKALPVFFREKKQLSFLSKHCKLYICVSPLFILNWRKRRKSGSEEKISVWRISSSCYEIYTHTHTHTHIYIHIQVPIAYQ